MDCTVLKNGLLGDEAKKARARGAGGLGGLVMKRWLVRRCSDGVRGAEALKCMVLKS